MVKISKILANRKMVLSRVLTTKLSIRHYSHIRDAGGKFAERGKALEDQYFSKRQTEILKKLREDLIKKADFERQQLMRFQAELKQTTETLEAAEEIVKDMADQAKAIVQAAQAEADAAAGHKKTDKNKTPTDDPDDMQKKTSALATNHVHDAYSSAYKLFQQLYKEVKKNLKN